MEPLFLAGAALIIGYVFGKLSNLVKLPQVVGYIIVGVILGPSIVKFIRPETFARASVISDVALGFVAFMIGSELRFSMLKPMGKKIFAIIVGESLGAFLLVFLGTWILTRNISIALILGALAPASAPAGTVVVLQEYRARGPLTNSILTVVGLDDGFAIMIYAFASAIARLLIKGRVELGTAILQPMLEILGAIVLGGIMGILLGFVLRRVRTDTHYITIVLGMIFLCTGLSNMFHVSLILSNLTLGMVIVNTFLLQARRVMDTLERITSPVFVLFFVLVGAHLDIGLLPQMGLLGLVYILSRSAGLIGGSSLAAVLTRSNPVICKYLGLGILSQAGVAIGLALLVVNQFSPLGPEGAKLASIAVNTVAATTVVFGIIGPLAVKVAITKAGEIRAT